MPTISPDSVTVFNGVIDILETFPMLQDVIGGVPASIPARTTAWVAMLDRPAPGGPTGQAAGTLKLDSALMVTFGYRVSEDLATLKAAETTLLQATDLWIATFYSDRTLDGLLPNGGELDLTLAGTPDYVAIASQEFRQYPTLLRFRQNLQYP